MRRCSPFQAAMIRSDWEQAEKERLAAISALETYLDHILLAQKEMAK